MDIGKACGAVVATVIAERVKQATKYLGETLTVKATHRGTWNGRDRRNEVLLTWGSPNWSERKFIRLAKRAGEPFPIKKIQVKVGG